MKTFDDAHPWLKMHRSDPLFISLKKTNTQLLAAIKKAPVFTEDDFNPLARKINKDYSRQIEALEKEKKYPQEVLEELKRGAERQHERALNELRDRHERSYPTSRSQNISKPYLVDALADLYLNATGTEVTSSNKNQSVISGIIRILEPSLNCGTCAGIVKKIIRTRKERNCINSDI